MPFMPRSTPAAALALSVCLAAAGVCQDRTPDDRFEEAVKLHQAGRYAEAVAAYEAFLRAHPQAVEAISNLGAAYSRMGNYGKAVEQYERALALDASNLGVRFNLGLAYYDSGQFGLAATEFERLMKAQAGNVRAAVLLADCRFREGDYKRVIELLTPFETSAGNNRALLYLLGTALIRNKQSEKGEKLVNRIMGQGDSAEAHFMLGLMRMMTLDAAGAVAEYEKALRLNAKLPGLHSAAGQAYLSLGDQPRALAEFRAELEVNPNDFDANLMLGVLLRKEEKLDEASAHLLRALDIRPGTPDAGYQVALVALAKGDLAAAQARLEKLTERYPGFVEAHVSLATVYYRLQRRAEGDRERDIVRKLNAEQQAASLAGLRTTETKSAPSPPETVRPQPKAPAKIPSSPPPAPPATFEALAARAAAARDAERVDEAAELYRQAVRARPSWAEGWWYLGTLSYDADRYTEARAAFERVAALKPKAGPGLAMLGLCEFRLKDYANALEHIEQARSYGLGEDEELVRVARYHSAILQTRFGRPDNALRILNWLARAGAASPDLFDALGLAVLRMAMLPAEIPENKRELVRLAGRAQAQAANRDRVAAGKLFADLAAEYPNEPGVHYSYGVFLLAEDGSRALAEFQRELSISPKDVPTRLQIAFECLRRAEYKAGLPYAEEAVKLAPESFAARNALGRLLMGDEQVGRAIQELEEGVKLAPDSPETRFALAQAYGLAGRKQDAGRERAVFKRLEEERRKRDSAASRRSAEPSPDREHGPVATSEPRP